MPNCLPQKFQLSLRLSRIPGTPPWIPLLVTGWFQEYEHGSASPSDIHPAANLKRLGNLLVRVAEFASKLEGEKDFQTVRDSILEGMESLQFFATEMEAAILDDLFLSIES